MSRSLNIGVGAVVVAAVAMPAVTAHGQMGMMMQGQGGDTSITRKGFDAYVRILGMDADQKEVARDLMEGNRAANKALMEEMQAKMKRMGEKARESGDWTVFQTEMPKIGEEFQDKAKKLEEQFFSDLKGLLTPAQVEKFGGVERHRRREIAMRFGMTYGMSTDVVEVARLAKIDVDKNEEMKAAIERYEMDLDSLLKSYEKLGKDAQKDAMKGGFDQEKIESALKPLTDAARQVRDINRSAVKRIAGLITDEKLRNAFELEVKRREFPRIYKEAYVQKSLGAAIKLSGLEESQKSQITSLNEQYEREASSINERWAKALEAREEKSGGRIKLLMTMWEPSEDRDKDMKEAKKAREELDEKTQTRLEGILKDEQKAQLPQKRPDAGSGGFGMGMFEDFGWDFSQGDEDK